MAKNTLFYCVTIMISFIAYGMEREEKNASQALTESSISWVSLLPELKITILSFLQTAPTFEASLKQIRALSSVSKEFQILTKNKTAMKIFLQYYIKRTKKEFFELVQANNVEEVQNFLEAGFDPNVYGPDGTTAFHNAVLEATKIYKYTTFNRNKKVLRLLLEHKADVNMSDNQAGKTPLMTAIEHGLTELTELLLKNGADKTIKDKKGNTALTFAQRYLAEVDELPDHDENKYDLRKVQLKIIQMLQEDKK